MLCQDPYPDILHVELSLLAHFSPGNAREGERAGSRQMGNEQPHNLVPYMGLREAQT